MRPYCLEKPYHAVSFSVSSTLTIAIAHAQPISRQVANTITEPLYFTTLGLATALSVPTFSHTFSVAYPIPLAQIAVSPAQWPTQLHTKQQIALKREELYSQPYPQGCVASTPECKDCGRSLDQKRQRGPHT